MSKSLESTVAGGRSPMPGDGRGATDDAERRRSRPGLLARIFLQEDLNFLLTNRIPRRLATRLMGWFSAIESRWLAAAVVALWRRLDPELDLAEAKTQRFTSLRDCFTRELRAGARPIAADADVVTSPCDAIVGALGTVERGMAIQAKGFPYPLKDLLVDDERVVRHAGGRFVTLRLKASMYHRFHAPTDCRVERVDYVSGDTWNVHPIALRRVERLFCRNERLVIDLVLPQPNEAITLVPVAAILVASMRLHGLPEPLNLRYRGPNRIDCPRAYRRGEEMGWFEHGSTIVVFATGGLEFAEGVVEGATLRMGRPLLLRVATGGDPVPNASPDSPDQP